MRQIDIYIDGAAKGNPGPAGIGVVISRDDKVLKNIAQYIGETTNNVAEYTALICGLEEALLLKAESVHIRSDSELLCRQISGQYKVKHPNLVGLYSRAKRMFEGFKNISLQHIPREQNKGADKLANQAVKEALKKR